MSVYIELFHGRHTPDEELDYWGFQGPVLGPFPRFHTTYGSDIKLGDEGIIVMGQPVELPVPDNDGLIKFLGSYYGDMSVMSSKSSNYDLRKRWHDTHHALRFTMEDLPKHINSPIEWIKIYAIHTMKGEL